MLAQSKCYRNTANLGIAIGLEETYILQQNLGGDAVLRVEPLYPSGMGLSYSDRQCLVWC